MAMKAKGELKDIFSGLNGVYVKKNGLDNFTSLNFDYDMPVTVDSFSFNQAEPTLNRTKVHGLQADWTVTSTAGEVTISATVPTIDDELTSWFLGGGTDIASAVLNGDSTSSWSGKSYTLQSVKLYMGLGLISDDKTKLCLIKKIAVYATPLFENASTTPFGFRLTGTIEASDDAEDNIAFLTKGA